MLNDVVVFDPEDLSISQHMKREQQLRVKYRYNTVSSLFDLGTFSLLWLREIRDCLAICNLVVLTICFCFCSLLE
jgi:hypothetical protein